MAGKLTLHDEMVKAGVSIPGPLLDLLKREDTHEFTLRAMFAADIRDYWQYSCKVDQARRMLIFWWRVISRSRNHQKLPARHSAGSDSVAMTVYRMIPELKSQAVADAVALAKGSDCQVAGKRVFVLRSEELDWTKANKCKSYRYPNRRVIYEVVMPADGWDAPITLAAAWNLVTNRVQKAHLFNRLSADAYRAWKRAPELPSNPGWRGQRLKSEDVLNALEGMSPDRRAIVIPLLPEEMMVSAICKFA